MRDWLAKRNGWIDPSRFLRGQISLYFTGLIETPEGVIGYEDDLYGEITSFVQVPEPSSIILLTLGLLGLAYSPKRRRIHLSSKSTMALGH